MRSIRIDFIARQLGFKFGDAIFELGEGLHIYGEPVPQGMVATQVEVTGPPGFTTLEAELPPTETLHLEAMGVDLEVWSGTVDIAVPFYARGELASETRPLDAATIDIQVTVRYQACTDQQCLLPTTETFTLSPAMDVIDVPRLGVHVGHGQRESDYDSTPALRRTAKLGDAWYPGSRNPKHRLDTPERLANGIDLHIMSVPP